MSRYVQLVFALGLFTGIACINWHTAPAQSAKLTNTFDLQKLHTIGSAITKARAEKRLPGGVLWVEHNGVHFTRAYGKASVEPIHVSAQRDTIYDAASLTKVVATTPAVMLLHQRGLLDINDPVKNTCPNLPVTAAARLPSAIFSLTPVDCARTSP